jgi:hypothetical protein
VTVGPPERKVKPNAKNRINLRASAHPHSAGPVSETLPPATPETSYLTAFASSRRGVRGRPDGGIGERTTLL